MQIAARMKRSGNVEKSSDRAQNGNRKRREGRATSVSVRGMGASASGMSKDI